MSSILPLLEFSLFCSPFGLLVWAVNVTLILSSPQLSTISLFFISWLTFTDYNYFSLFLSISLHPSLPSVGNSRISYPVVSETRISYFLCFPLSPPSVQSTKRDEENRNLQAFLLFSFLPPVPHFISFCLMSSQFSQMQLLSSSSTLLSSHTFTSHIISEWLSLYFSRSIVFTLTPPVFFFFSISSFSWLNDFVTHDDDVRKSKISFPVLEETGVKSRKKVLPFELLQQICRRSNI